MPRKQRASDILDSIILDENKEEPRISRRKRKSSDEEVLQELLQSPKQARLISPPLIDFNPSFLHQQTSFRLSPVTIRQSGVSLEQQNRVSDSDIRPSSSSSTIRRHLSLPVPAETFYGSPNRRCLTQSRQNNTPPRERRDGATIHEHHYTLRARKSPIVSRPSQAANPSSTGDTRPVPVTSANISGGESSSVTYRERNGGIQQSVSHRMPRSLSLDMSQHLLSSVPRYPDFPYPSCPLLHSSTEPYLALGRDQFNNILPHCPVCPPTPLINHPNPHNYSLCPCHLFQTPHLPSDHPALTDISHVGLQNSFGGIQNFQTLERRHSNPFIGRYDVPAHYDESAIQQQRQQLHSRSQQQQQQGQQQHQHLHSRSQQQRQQLQVRQQLQFLHVDRHGDEVAERNRVRSDIQHVMDLNEVSRTSASLQNRNSQISENHPPPLYQCIRGERSGTRRVGHVSSSEASQSGITPAASAALLMMSNNNNNIQIRNLNSALADITNSNIMRTNYPASTEHLPPSDQTSFSSSRSVRDVSSASRRSSYNNLLRHQHQMNRENMPPLLDRLMWMVDSGTLTYMPLQGQSVPINNYYAQNYETLLGLAQQLSESKPKGLNKMEIDQLPLYHYNTEMKHSELSQTSCVVCMCDFENRQRLRVLVCKHEFHSKCIDKWLRTNRSCPVCRSDALELKASKK